MNFQNISLERRDRVSILTINRPPANSINLATMEEIGQALNDLERDRQVRVVIFTGAGEKGFSAGFDVSDAANADRIGPLGQQVWTRVDLFPKPVIAAINGYAFGGGCELAMACTFRLMMEGARIGLTELNLGIIPGWGGTQRMPRLIGRAKALDLILFSRRLTAAEALQIGLVDKVFPQAEFMKEVMAFADVLAKRPPIAVSAVLKAVHVGLDRGLDEGTRAELEGSRAVSKSQDAREGFTAFFEKREPNFTGE
jgi:enoyl-CoA hydratase/carnithine racemase